MDKLTQYADLDEWGKLIYNSIMDRINHALKQDGEYIKADALGGRIVKYAHKCQ